jgi:hypothetical protein
MRVRRAARPQGTERWMANLGTGQSYPTRIQRAIASSPFAQILSESTLMNLAAGSRRSVRQILCLLQHFDCLFHRE